MPDPRLLRLFEQLRAARFADVKGARVTAAVPVGERLLNEVVSTLLPPTAPVRDLLIRPLAANRIAVRARASRLEFLPPVTINLQIEQQPQLPNVPLVLRIMSMPGLLSLAGSLLAPNSFPPGIRLERDRVLVDVRTLLERNGAADLVSMAERVNITSEEGRLLVELHLRV